MYFSRQLEAGGAVAKYYSVYGMDILIICWELVDNDLNILDISKIQENDQRSTFQLSNNGSFYNVDIY